MCQDTYLVQGFNLYQRKGYIHHKKHNLNMCVLTTLVYNRNCFSLWCVSEKNGCFPMSEGLFSQCDVGAPSWSGIMHKSLFNYNSKLLNDHNYLFITLLCNPITVPNASQNSKSCTLNFHLVLVTLPALTPLSHSPSGEVRKGSFMASSFIKPVMNVTSVHTSH